MNQVKSCSGSVVMMKNNNISNTQPGAHLPFQLFEPARVKPN